MLNALPKRSDYIFHPNTSMLRSTFAYQRARTATKLNNLRIKRITFHTLRHWKGTMEYHGTKDILHVKALLGHKSIQNTLIYITIDQAIFRNHTDEFHVKTAKTAEEACKLIEVGFEYVNAIGNVHIYRKRK